jgi:hypothetical protein
MQIRLEEPVVNCQKLYLGTRWRYPTVTDVKFLSPTRLLVAHRHAKKLYLIEFSYEEKRYSVLHTLVLPILTESLAVIGSRIYSLSFSPEMCIVELVGDKMVFVKRVHLSSFGVNYHGIRAVGDLLYCTPSSDLCSEGHDSIVVYDTAKDTSTFLTSPDLLQKYRIKDMVFVGEHVVLALHHKGITHMGECGHVPNGRLGLFTRDLRLLDTHDVPHTHFDLMSVQGTQFYAVAADTDGGAIYTGEVLEGKLCEVQRIPCEDFPHGIDLCGPLLAYTSYATSSVYIRDCNGL